MENNESMGKALSDLKKSGYEADLDFGTDSFCLYCSDLDMRLLVDANDTDAGSPSKQDSYVSNKE